MLRLSHSWIALGLVAQMATAQVQEETAIAQDSIAESEVFIVDVDEFAPPADSLIAMDGIPAIYGVQNAQRLRSKWNSLQAGDRKKLRWVHLGDSHIQADILTAEVRTILQQHSGNGGRGWVFPHRLAGTNGASDYRFQSTTAWKNYRNIKPQAAYPVGLAGIALYTAASTAAMELSVKDPQYAFTSARFIVPSSYGQWGEVSGRTAQSTVQHAPKTHTIKSGESLSTIAKKYSTTVRQLQQINGLKSTAIRAGKKLKVGVQPQSATTYKWEIAPLANGFKTWETPQTTWEFGALAGDSGIALSGLWLENEQNGHVYSAIGVNGAKFTDYLKYPAFFTELAQTQADVLVLSFGTNESYDHQSWDQFRESVVQMVAQARAVLPDLDIVVTTPPPSYLHKNPINSYVATYAQGLANQADELDIIVIDWFEFLGGANRTPALIRQGLLSKDRVHYTLKGYQLQGKSLAQALIALLQL